MVLFPQGQPATEAARARCESLVFRCGGDPQRMIDGPASTVDHFATHAARIAVLRDALEAPIVVFTRVSPISRVLLVRRDLEARLPVLAGAAWLLYFEPESEPLTMDTADALGDLDGGLAIAPLWTCDDMRFLLLSPAIDDRAVLWPRVEALAWQADRLRESGIQLRGRSSLD
jgi:hypothetical protein